MLCCTPLLSGISHLHIPELQYNALIIQCIISAPSHYHPRPAKILQNIGKLMWTLIVILQEQELEDCAEAVFSSDHSWHRCGLSVVQATALLLVMQIVF